MQRFPSDDSIAYLPAPVLYSRFGRSPVSRVEVDPVLLDPFVVDPSTFLVSEQHPDRSMILDPESHLDSWRCLDLLSPASAHLAASVPLKQNEQYLALRPHPVFAFPCNVFPLVELKFRGMLAVIDPECCVRCLDTFASPLR